MILFTSASATYPTDAMRVIVVVHSYRKFRNSQSSYLWLYPSGKLHTVLVSHRLALFPGHTQRISFLAWVLASYEHSCCIPWCIIWPLGFSIFVRKKETCRCHRTNTLCLYLHMQTERLAWTCWFCEPEQSLVGMFVDNFAFDNIISHGFISFIRSVLCSDRTDTARWYDLTLSSAAMFCQRP